MIMFGNDERKAIYLVEECDADVYRNDPRFREIRVSDGSLWESVYCIEEVKKVVK